jgi:hypothetical protein
MEQCGFYTLWGLRFGKPRRCAEPVSVPGFHSIILSLLSFKRAIGEGSLPVHIMQKVESGDTAPSPRIPANEGAQEERSAVMIPCSMA